MKLYFKKYFIFSLFFFLILAFADFAQAVTIDFGIIDGIGQDSGSINYQGSGLIGTDIEVDQVSIIENDASAIDLTNGRLNFQTGSCTFYDSTYNLWYFTGGANTEIKIEADDYTEPLMQGQWNSAGVVLIESGSFQMFVLGGSFNDQKNAKFLDSLGFNIGSAEDKLVGSFDGGINLSFNADLLTSIHIPMPGPYFESKNIASGDVHNLVPIPGAAWILGAGLLGLIGFHKRFI